MIGRAPSGARHFLASEEGAGSVGRALDLRVTHTIGVAMLCVLVGWSWQAHLAPAMRRVLAGRQHLVQLRQQIEQTEQMVQRAGGQEAWMTAQRAQLRELAKQVPSSNEMPRLLDAIVSRVVSPQLRLVNVAQGNVEPALQADGTPLLLGSRACVRLPVTVTVEGRFRAVVAYLEELTGREFPGLVQIHQASCVVREPTTAVLTATVSLVLYALD